MPEPALVRTTVRPYRIVLIAASAADVDTACILFDRSLGGRTNILLPTNSEDRGRLRQMLVAFDPDVVVSDAEIPQVVARLRLPTVSFKEARARTFPLTLASDLQKHFDGDGGIFVGDEIAPRHVRVNLGCLQADDLKSLRDDLKGQHL